MLRKSLHCLCVILRPVEHLINPGVSHPSKRYRVDCVCRTKLHLFVEAGWKGKEFMPGRKEMSTIFHQFWNRHVRALVGFGYGLNLCGNERILLMFTKNPHCLCKTVRLVEHLINPGRSSTPQMPSVSLCSMVPFLWCSERATLPVRNPENGGAFN